MLGDLRMEIERMALDSIASLAGTGKAIMKEIVTRVPVVWDEAVISREAADWAGRYGYDLIRGITDNTARLVGDKVRSFTETPGMTIGQLRQMLTGAFGQSRAQAIAVTETTRAYAEGNRMVQAELQRAGLEMTLHWQTSGSDVCDLCSPLDGKPEDEWGEASDGPPRHPRCRCWTVLRRRAEAAGTQETQFPVGSRLPSGPWEPMMNEREEVIAAIPRHGVEYGYVVTPDGKVLLNKKGSRTRVSITRQEAERISGGNIFTHNHPNGYTFSDGDIQCHLYYGHLESRAVGILDGVRHRHRLRMDGFTYSDWPQLKREYKQIHKALATEERAAVLTGEITLTEANNAHWHNVLRRLVENYQAVPDKSIIYERAEW
jgi:hypothetical protein